MGDRPPVMHELKTVPPYFDFVLEGRKTFDVRRDDRGFQEGDLLDLREYDPDTRSYSGPRQLRRVLYVLRGYEGLAPGHVAMSLGPAEGGAP